MNWPKLTDRERRLLDLVPLTGAPISSSDLVARYYVDEAMPFNARPIIISRMNGIMRKLNTSAAGAKLRKSKRNGPKPVSYWLEIHT